MQFAHIVKTSLRLALAPLGKERRKGKSGASGPEGRKEAGGPERKGGERGRKTAEGEGGPGGRVVLVWREGGGGGPWVRLGCGPAGGRRSGSR